MRTEKNQFHHKEFNFITISHHVYHESGPPAFRRYIQPADPGGLSSESTDIRFPPCQSLSCLSLSFCGTMTMTASPTPRRRSRRPGNAARPCSNLLYHHHHHPSAFTTHLHPPTDQYWCWCYWWCRRRLRHSPIEADLAAFFCVYIPVLLISAARPHNPKTGCEFRFLIMFMKAPKEGIQQHRCPARFCSPPASVFCFFFLFFERGGVDVCVWGDCRLRSACCCCCCRLFAGKVTDNKSL